MKISANNLIFRTLTKTIIDSVSFFLESGQKVAFYGSEGSGKKALLLMLGGYLKPTSGTVTTDDINIFSELESYRSHIGLGEIDNINALAEEMSIRENIRFVLEIGGFNYEDITVQKVLDRFNVKTYADTSIKYCPPFARAIASLACATAHNPDIVILDEPTRRLTSLESKKYWEIANSILQNKTVLFSTKDFDEARMNSQRIIALAGGHLIKETL
ncbi:MAG: ATP-binding cassette domain-containing protein [Candidatus Pacebacteria bacterium]|nr:ATP-binding cassette domain-containing protein [Candidatus Paceibacterota bacterium]